MRLLNQVLAPKTEPKSTQYRKRHSKIDIAIDLRFFIDFWSPRDSKMEAPKFTCPSQTFCFTAWERKPAFWTRSEFWIDVGALLASFWNHFGPGAARGTQMAPGARFEAILSHGRPEAPRWLQAFILEQFRNIRVLGHGRPEASRWPQAVP